MGEAGHGYRRLFFVFSFLTFLSLSFLLTVSNSLYHLLLFAIFSSYSFQMSLSETSHRIIDLPRPTVPLLSLHLTSLPVLRFPFFQHDRPISTYTTHQFLLLIVLHSNLHSQCVHSSLTYSHYSCDSSYPAVFHKIAPSLVVSLLVPTSL